MVSFTSTFIRKYGCRYCFLKLTGISYENYKIGGDIINFFLEPATICFAIPLYRKREVLKILVTNIWWYSCWYNYCLVINLSCCNNIPIWQSNYSIYATSSCNDSNCITVSDGIGGVKELTSLAVILNAVVISALGAKIVKLFKISNPIARGLALGTSGHTLGVAAAKVGETEESMGVLQLSSLALLL